MSTDSLTDALRGLDPARRALLDLSLRHGIRPDDLAEVLGMDSAEIVSLREDALAAVAGEGGRDVDRARAALAELPLEEWVASASPEEPAEPAAEAPSDHGLGQAAPGAEAAPDSAADHAAAETESDEGAPDEPDHTAAQAEAEKGSTAEEPGHAIAGAEAEHTPQQDEHPTAGEAEHAANAEAEEGAAADDHTSPHGEPGQAAPAGEASGGADYPSSPFGDVAIATATNGHPLVDDETPAKPAASAAGATTPPKPAQPRRRSRLLLAVVAACALIALVVSLAVSGGSHTATRHPAPLATHPAAPPPAAPRAVSTTRSASLAPLGAGGSGAHGSAQVGSGRVLHVTIGGLPSPRSGTYELWLYNSVVDSTPLAHFAGSSTSLNVTLPPGYRRYRYLDVSLQQSVANPNPSGVSVLRVPLRALAPTG